VVCLRLAKPRHVRIGKDLLTYTDVLEDDLEVRYGRIDVAGITDRDSFEDALFRQVKRKAKTDPALFFSPVFIDRLWQGFKNRLTDFRTFGGVAPEMRRVSLKVRRRVLRLRRGGTRVFTNNGVDFFVVRYDRRGRKYGVDLGTGKMIKYSVINQNRGARKL